MLAWAGTASAQDEEIMARVKEYYAKVPQEKIYVHTDKACYAAGDTIWYRAHLVDAATNKPVSRSRFVNIELYDRSADSLVDRQIVKCDSDGVFANALLLPKRLSSGLYTLVAYTQWMRNFGAEGFFYKPLLILSDSDTPVPLAPFSAAFGDTSPRESESVCPPHGDRLEVKGIAGIYQRGNYIYIPTPAGCAEDDLFVVYGSGQIMTFTPQQGKVNRIDATTFGSGNVHVAMVKSDSLTVLAEQSFLLKETNAPVVSINGTATTEAKSPMTVDIVMRDADGSPVQAICSVSVTDYDVVKPDTILPDIREYLTRTSERALSGPVLQDMLTGNYPAIQYGFQTHQTITGSVRGTWRKHLKNPKLLFVNTRLGQRHEFELGDSSRFSVIVDNPENSTFVLQGARKNGNTSFVELDIDPQTFPQPHLPQPCSRLMGMAEAEKFVTQAYQQQTYSSLGTIELPELVKKSAKKKTKNYSLMEAARSLQEGDSRIEHAVSMRALLHPLGIYTTYIDGEEHFRKWQVGKCYVDNFVEEDDNYVLNISPTDVKSIEYFTPNDPRNTLFGVRADERGRVPGVLFIFLKDGSEYLRTAQKELLSMATVNQLGYRYPREFWSPQYPDADKSQYTRPDHRTTLYWNPKVATDETGRATVTFYSSDISKQYLVTIEGVTADGTIISRQEVIK